MRKLLLSLFILVLSVAPAFADSMTDLKAQIDMLQKQLNDLSAQLQTQKKADSEANKELLDKLEKVDAKANEGRTHATKDRLDLGIELRTQFNSINYESVYGLPAYANDMMQLWLTDKLVTDELGTDAWANAQGFNEAWMDEYFPDFYNVVMNSFPDAEFYGALATLGNADAFGQLNGDILNAVDDGYSVYRANLVAWFIDTYGGLPDMNASGAVDFTDLVMAMEASGSMTPQGPVAADGNFDGIINPQTEPVSAGNLLNTVLAYMFSRQTLTDQEITMFKRMFTSGVEPRKYSTSDSAIWTNRLRLRLSSKINDNVRFAGRLAVYKAWGDTSRVKWMDGTFQSMYMDGNSGAYPQDDNVHLERAYFVYSAHDGLVPWHLSLGRRPSTYGLGVEAKENAPLGGSPLAHIIQWNFDGGSLGFDLEEATGIYGLNVKFCYGVGYESQNGTMNSLAANNGLISVPQQKDVHFYGLIVRAFDDGDYKFYYNYALGKGITDGFTGEVAMPFIISGHDNDMDGDYDEYSFSPNLGGFTSNTEAMTEMGDLEMHSFFLGGNTMDFNWFLSYSLSRTLPNGNRSDNPMYQVMDADYMMGSTSSKSGESIWLGVLTPKIEAMNGAQFGIEYNQGSKYWMNMTGGDGELAGSKLAVRGKVWEAYYHQPIVGERFFVTLGYMYYDYDYTGSGNFMGEPQKIGGELDGLHAMMPSVDKMSKAYFNATYRF